MVVTLYQVGKIIEGIATNKSKEAVARAVNLRIEHAARLVNGEIQEVSPEMLDVNDMIVVTAGEYIPVDAVVISGDGQVDTSSLTGEFVPVSAKEGMELYSGYLLKEGTLNLKVIRTYQNSAVSKIIDLISNSGAKKSKADEFVSRFAKWYTPIVFIVSLLVAIIGGAITNNWKDWVILGLKMMVVACPCAIVISVPLAYFAALGLASKNGIVFKGTNYIDELNRMEKLVTDKTGTLTKGVFEISKIVPIGVKEDFLLDVMSSVESLSNHPIGKTIAKLKKSSVLSENFEELAGLGVCAEYKGDMVLIGNSKLLNEYEIKFEEVDENGVVVYCVYDGKYIGYLVISDEVRESSKELVSSLQNSGVDVVLLTGDKEHNTQKLCSELGITVNELLSGEVIKMDNYNKEMENKLIEMVRQKEESDRRLLALEWVIGILAGIVLFVPIFIGALLPMEDWQKTIIVFSGFIPGVVGFCFAMRIEQIAGYYECKHCKHKYVPTYKAVNLAPHIARTRYMKCPECGRRSWQRKRLTK